MKRLMACALVALLGAVALAGAAEQSVLVTFAEISNGDTPGSWSYGSVANTVAVDYNLSAELGNQLRGWRGDWYPHPGIADGALYNTGADGIGSIRFSALQPGHEVKLDSMTLAGGPGSLNSSHGQLRYSYNATDWFEIDTGPIPPGGYATVALNGSGGAVIQGATVYLQWRDNTGSGEADFALDDIAFRVGPAMSGLNPPEIVPIDGPLEIDAGDRATFSFDVNIEDAGDTQTQVDWGDGTVTVWSGWTSSSDPISVVRAWDLPGTYVLRARARDRSDAVSDWVELRTVSVTGLPQNAVRTPPYLQNMSPTGMVIMAEIAAEVPLVVQYGLTADYASSVQMAANASGGDSYFYRAMLAGLEAGTVYHYRLATPAGEELTGDATFRTAPPRWEDFSFSALGALDTTNRGAWDADPWEPGKTMLQDMVDRGARFMVGLGDHTEDGNSYAAIRESHLARTAALLGSRVPFYIAWGSQDGSSITRPRGMVDDRLLAWGFHVGSSPTHPMRLSADMPSRHQLGDSVSTRTPGHGNYSFSYGGVFFVCLDYFQTHDLAADDPGNDLTNGWLDERLSSLEARQARFRVVAVNMPPFSERRVNGNALLREQLVPRLEQHGVELCLSAYAHEYARGQLNGVHYIIAGGGSYLDHDLTVVQDWAHMTAGGLHNVAGTYARQSAPGVLGAPQPIVGGLFHHYLQIHVRGRFLRVECHGFNADGSYIGVLDTLEIGEDPGPDSNGDGMRDAWKVEHGMDPNSDTGSNAPGYLRPNGMTNIQHFWAGTDPREPSARFVVHEVQAPSVPHGEAWRIFWPSVAGRWYEVVESRDLSNWNSVPVERGGGAVPASGGGVTSADILPLDTISHFIKVRLLVL